MLHRCNSILSLMFCFLFVPKTTGFLFVPKMFLYLFLKDDVFLICSLRRFLTFSRRYFILMNVSSKEWI